MSITTTHREKRFLRAQLQSIEARKVLEIGAFKGETTCVICEAVEPRDGQVAVIDPMQWSAEVLRNGVMRHFERPFPKLMRRFEAALGAFGYERDFWKNVGRRTNVHLFRGLSTSGELLASSDPHLQDLDAVFIDGDHSYEGAAHDLSRWASRVVPGGLVLVHDVTSRFPGVVRALDEWWSPDRCETGGQVESLCAIRVRTDAPARADHIPITPVTPAAPAE